MDRGMMMTPESLQDLEGFDNFGYESLSASPYGTITPSMLDRNPGESQYPFGSSTPETLPDDLIVPVEHYGDVAPYIAGTRTFKRQSLELLQMHSVALHAAVGMDVVANTKHNAQSSALRDWSPDAQSYFEEAHGIHANDQNYSSTLSGLPSTPPMQKRARTLADAAFTDDVNRFIDFERYGLVAPDESPTRRPSRRVLTLPEDELVDLINK
jgi:hypothetical protein